jgi:Fe-S-cluster containining protein
MDFEHPRNVRFKCERCTMCCGDTGERIRSILLLKPEAERVSSKTLKLVSEFATEFEGSDPYVYEMKKTENGKCVFLKDDSCSIYTLRPLVCRFYPFELKPDSTGKYVFSYTNECSSIGRGPKLKREYFEDLFERSLALLRKSKR